jgi:hypothetical protein
MKELIENLRTSKLYRFADWKDNTIPNICAGVYAVYDSDENFIYIGMAGAELNKEKIAAKEKIWSQSSLRFSCYRL